MSVIDHGILIPAPPDRVWHLLSDINRLPEWHADCRSVTFLTSLRSGPGTRWRLTSKRGREYVLEITTWYDRLGYEYRYIDGVSLRENRGLLRLQEVAEGTIVQWTFNYRPKRLIGGTGLGNGRAINTMMVDSLRTLYRRLTKGERTAEEIDFEAKSLMRDAPDVEARQHYRPRHPSVLEGQPSDAPTARADRLSPAPPTEQANPFARPAPAPLDPAAAAAFLDPFYEPPIAESDTRPNPAAAETGSASVAEPDFLRDEPDSAFSKRPSDTMRLVPSDAPASPVDRDGTIDLDGPTRVGITPPKGVPADHPALQNDNATGALPWLPAHPESPATAPAPMPAVPSALDSATPTEALPSLPRFDDEELDTSKMSVFEIFGLPKPSETQEMRAVSSPEPPAPEALPRSPSATDSATVPLPFLPIAPPSDGDTPDAAEGTSTPPQAEAMMDARNQATTAVVSQLTHDAQPVGTAGRVGLRAQQRRATAGLRRPG